MSEPTTRDLVEFAAALQGRNIVCGFDGLLRDANFAFAALDASSLATPATLLARAMPKSTARSSRP